MPPAMESTLIQRKHSYDCMNQKVFEKVGKLMHNFAKSPSFSYPENNNLEPAEPLGSTRNQSKPQRTSLPEKEFLLRQSPLTELLEVPHFRTIHHIFIASLVLILLNSFIMDLSDDGIVDFGIQRLLWALGDIQRTWTLILSMHAAAILLLYPSFNYWSYSRQTLGSKELRKLLDKTALGFFAIFLIAFIYIPGKILLSNPLPFASALVATMEQGRLLMKMYAFVRSNIPRALNHYSVPLLRRKSSTSNLPLPSLGLKGENGNMDAIKENVVSQFSDKSNGLRPREIPEIQDGAQEKKIKNDTVKNYLGLTKRESWLACENDDHLPCPGFTKYLYFLFAPTLVYRDQYPRTKKIRWNYVCWNFAQVIGCFLYGSYILNRFCAASFSNFGAPGHKFNLRDMVQSFFALMLPGSLTLLLMFFAILHAWQNAFAEMLYFGDRLFYKDWWNCSSFAVYYKTWNVLVHDWLYTYIFKDTKESELGNKWKPLPSVLVFLVSSLFHEYILIVSFHVFFPALLFFFGGFGFVFLFVGNRKKNSALGNFLVWMALMSGTGMIIAAYAMEVYARSNCPVEDSSSFFIPRLLSCGAINFTWLN